MKKIKDHKSNGRSWNVRFVAGQKVADFTSDVAHAIPDLSPEDNKKALTQIHAECTALVKATDTPEAAEVKK